MMGRALIAVSLVEGNVAIKSEINGLSKQELASLIVNLDCTVEELKNEYKKGIKKRKFARD